MLPGPFGKDGAVNVVVETPRGADVKYKHDPETGCTTVSRALPAGIRYPFDWGFIPSTRAPDGDPIDAMIVWECATYPGVVVPCRLIGVLQVEQTDRASGRRQRNDRLFAVPVKAPRLDDVRTIFDVPERTRAELEQFFLAVVAFEGKALALLGFAGPAEATAALQTSLGSQGS